MTHPGNFAFAEIMQEIADLLAVQDASPFRINAYRNAAQEIAKQSINLRELARKGKIKELEALPAIGKRIASLISEYARTGECRYLNRLKGELSIEQYLEKIPGIGPTLAQRVVESLEIHTLEELEEAIHDGRLARIPGFGEDRVRLTKVILENWFDRLRPRKSISPKPTPEKTGPSNVLLLELDKTYRRLVKEKKLQKIAPRRFNPEEKAWLPIYHTDRDGWHFTVLFSNTALAHQLNKQEDWVIIYFYNDKGEGQVTIVTETKGPAKGKRVIRGQGRASKKPDELSVLQDW